MKVCCSCDSEYEKSNLYRHLKSNQNLLDRIIQTKCEEKVFNTG